VAAATGLDYTVLRYYHVIGPRQDDSENGGVAAIFARRALASMPLIVHGTGEQTRSFTSVHDVVRANLLAERSPALRRRAVACASGVRVSIGELAAHVVARTGSGGGIEHAPVRPGDIRHFDIDAGPLRALGLDFDTDWRATVDDVIASLAGPVAA
jgi:nucleoside-diphosphate-sugar epimerase